MKKRPAITLCDSRRRNLGRPLLLLGVGLGLAAAHGAADPPQRTGEPILVSGQRLSQQAARDRAAQFVRSTGVASGQTPAARWTDPVCPQVMGLEEMGKRAAEAKVRSVAAAAGVEVAPEPCKANIVVSFTADAAALLREIERREPRRLSQLSARARESVLSGSAPIRWLYSIEVRGRDGDKQNVAGGAGQSTPATHAGSGAGSSVGGDMPSMMHYDSSILSTMTNRVLTGAIVVVDQDDVMGRRLDAIAAYAAFVALAEIRIVDAAPEGSILSLFSSPAPPRELTAQDLGFLRTLYRLPLDRPAMQHRSLLVHEIAGALAARD